MLINAHRISAAKEVLNRLEKIDPQSAFSHLGVIAWIEKRYNDALHFFSRCLEAEPDNFKAADNKIGLLFEMERYDEAVSIADKFIEKYGERRFRMYRVLAQLHFGISQKFNNKSSAEYDNQPCTFGSRILDESDEKWNDEKFFNTRKKNEHLRKALEIFNEIDEKEIHNPETRYLKTSNSLLLRDLYFLEDSTRFLRGRVKSILCLFASKIISFAHRRLKNSMMALYSMYWFSCMGLSSIAINKPKGSPIFERIGTPK